MHPRSLILVLVFAIGLSACGGGDDNGDPVAANGSLTVNEDGSGSVSLTVSDPDNDPLTASIVTQPTKGSVSVSSMQPLAFSYVPRANENGTDSFEYRVTDPDGAGATGRVTIAITAVADPVVMAAQAFTADEDVALDSIVVASDADGDAIAMSVTASPAHGSLQFNAATGAFRYTPAANFNGADSFSVRASDGGTLSADAVMTLAIRPVNDAPVTADDALVIPLSGTTSVNVTANDSDLDGDALGVEIVTPPPGANATVQGGTIQVTPNAGAAGPTSLVYRATDGA